MGTLLGCLGLVWGLRALVGFRLCSRGPKLELGVAVLVRNQQGFWKVVGEPYPRGPGGPGSGLAGRLGPHGLGLGLGH